MISSPRQPGIDIDVYLNPLMTKLWDDGVFVFDGYQNETFKLCAIFFVPLMTFQHTGI